MSELLGLTIAGLSLGAIYAISASGLVVTYTTSGVFNFAHGAIGMFIAFVYWQFRVDFHWAAPFALGVTLLVIAPALGFLVDWALIRRININDAGLMLMVTLAVLVALMGLAFTIWPQATGRNLPLMFGPNRHVSIGGNLIDYEEFLCIALAVVVAVGLRAFFFRTRLGVSMRASVDDRSLIALHGASPSMLSSLSWMIGAFLAGLAGVLTASTYALDIVNLTLLVLNGFAAAMLGRLRNLPLTFVGAIVLGLLDSYVTGYIHLTGWLSNLRPVLPTLFLFVVLLALPSVRIRAGAPAVIRSVRLPGRRRAAVNGVAIVVAAVVAAFVVHGTVLGDVNQGVALGIGALSIVVLSGYGGQVSLAQYSFFGFGAWVYAQVAPGGSPLGLVVVVLAGAALGAVVALPALRLRGLELALSTLAFGQLAYYMFFLQHNVMGSGDEAIPRLRLPGISLAGGRANLIFLAVVFALAYCGVLAVRRGRFGRLLSAAKDSEAASATLGINTRLTKIALFAGATALATFGGALYGSTQLTVSSDNFQYINSLFIVLVVYIWGVSAPGAALAGGLSLAVAPLIELHIPSRFDALTYLLTGFGALGLVVQPAGVLASIGDRARAALAFGGWGGPVVAGRTAPTLAVDLRGQPSGRAGPTAEPDGGVEPGRTVEPTIEAGVAP